MKLKCPRCGYEYDYREATREQAVLDVIRMQADFAPHSKLVFEYAELFGTTRPMKALKLLRVLSEVREIFLKGEFALQKRSYRISRDGVAAALKAVCNRTFAEPLANHNYLKKVMVSVAEEEGKARAAAEEKALMEKEATLRAGARRAGPFEDGAPARAGDVAKNVPWRRE